MDGRRDGHAEKKLKFWTVVESIYGRSELHIEFWEARWTLIGGMVWDNIVPLNVGKKVVSGMHLSIRRRWRDINGRAQAHGTDGPTDFFFLLELCQSQIWELHSSRLM
jgi:hypothetical protein